MYLLLHRAARNAGDHLIFERARALIAAERPNTRLDKADASRPLLDQVSLRTLAQYRAIVVCGGPGYAPGMARTYPLGDLDALPPVVLLALGSYVVPGTTAQLSDFRLSPEDRRFLDQVLTRVPHVGARDPLTARLLESNGYYPLMTGDPAWYDLDRMAADTTEPPAVRAIAFTPPANPVYFAQARGVIRRLALTWPGARIEVVHHRGRQRPFDRSGDLKRLVNHDITGSAAGFAVYDQVDIHVGYRVHAHLYATSRGVPSWLVAEDSRGVGAHQGLGPLGVCGFSDDLSRLVEVGFRVLPRVANATRRLTAPFAMPASRLLAMPDIAQELVGQIEEDLSTGLPRHRAARERIRATYPVMRQMIASLP